MLFLIHGRFDMNALMSADVPTLAASEADRVAALHEEGVVRCVWRRADRTGAILILDCDSAEQLGDVLLSLPLFAYIRDMEVTPLVAHPRFPEFGIIDSARA